MIIIMIIMIMIITHLQPLIYRIRNSKFILFIIFGSVLIKGTLKNTTIQPYIYYYNDMIISLISLITICLLTTS